MINTEKAACDFKDWLVEKGYMDFEEGLEDEVRTLLPYRGLTALDTVGYKEMFAFLDGKCSLEEAQDAICSHTWNYARRQMTWWKRDPDIQWIDL